MEKFNLTYKKYGENGILIEWPQLISTEILENITLFVKTLELNKPNYIEDFNYVYCSLLVLYNSKIDFLTLKTTLKSLYNSLNFSKNIPNHTCWEIPVCYHEKYGIDLQIMSTTLQVSIPEIVNLHSKVFYTVYGYGFLPGFLYLGGLPQSLNFPRKTVPRLSVFEGAVAIGGSQTGIYPQDSPGGWHIIGKTPIKLFDANNFNTLNSIQIGDLVKFKSISLDEFSALLQQFNQKKYKLKKYKI